MKIGQYITIPNFIIYDISFVFFVFTRFSDFTPGKVPSQQSDYITAAKNPQEHSRFWIV